MTWAEQSLDIQCWTQGHPGQTRPTSDQDCLDTSGPTSSGTIMRSTPPSRNAESWNDSGAAPSLKCIDRCTVNSVEQCPASPTRPDSPPTRTRFRRVMARRNYPWSFGHYYAAPSRLRCPITPQLRSWLTTFLCSSLGRFNVLGAKWHLRRGRILQWRLLRGSLSSPVLPSHRFSLLHQQRLSHCWERRRRSRTIWTHSQPGCSSSIPHRWLLSWRR